LESELEVDRRRKGNTVFLLGTQHTPYSSYHVNLLLSWNAKCN